MKYICLLVAVSCAFLVTTAAGQSSPDIVLVNGKIFTGDNSTASATAIAIIRERISAVGTDEVIRRMAGARTRVIELNGRTVVPGFNDAHTHIQPEPEAFRLNFTSMEPSWAEVSTAVRTAVKAVKPREWIFGAVGGDAFTNPELNRANLDTLAPNNPVLLTTYYGHGTVVNSHAMRLLNIPENVADPAGGWYERDSKTRRFNGRIFEYAQWRIHRLVADMVSDAAIIARIKKMGAEAAAFGITSMQIMPTISGQRFVRLLDQANLPIRIRAMPFSLTTPRGRDLSEIRAVARMRPANRKITTDGIKWILDGTPFEHGSAMRKPYADRPDFRGKLNFPKNEVEAMVRESVALNQQLLIHCSGDRCAETVMDAMENVGRGRIDWKTKRVRIEHGDAVAGDLIERARRLGIIVVQNPTHFTVTEMLYKRWTPQMIFSTQRSLIDGGVHYALGSDGPMNPFLNIMLATIHPARPTEAISRPRAVEAYTSGSAYAEFAETEKGTLAAGMLADLAVLSQDIFSVPTGALPETTSVMTIVGGKIVHDAKAVK